MPLQECFMSAEAQPPLPLHEFLPAQPLSPALQPPLPLQEFWPLHVCLSAEGAAALSLADLSSEAAGFALSAVLAVESWIACASREPANTPATARPIALVVRSPFFIHFSFRSPRLGSGQTAVKPKWLHRSLYPLPTVERDPEPGHQIARILSRQPRIRAS